MEDYQGEGLNLTKANNAVEAGLVKTWQDLSIGRIKVFSTLQHFFDEYRLYRRDEKGNIVKKKDHLMDDMRYITNSGAQIAMVKPVNDKLPGLTPLGGVGVGGY